MLRTRMMRMKKSRHCVEEMTRPLYVKEGEEADVALDHNRGS